MKLFKVYQRGIPQRKTSQETYEDVPIKIFQTLSPLPKYKVSGIYKPQICRKLAARLRLIVAARLPQTRFSYANYISGALLLHTMCATSMQRTVVAHCSGTQCAPQVCGAQLSRTVLVHNVRHKFAAHNCRALFWYTMCAASLRRTIVAHCSGTQCAPQVCSAQLSHTVLCATTHTQLPCTALFPPPPWPPPPPPTPPSPTPTPSLSPHPHIFF